MTRIVEIIVRSTGRNGGGTNAAAGPFPARIVSLAPIWGVGLLLLLYTGTYLFNPEVPGNNHNPCCTSGWLGWSDQGRYYASASAFEAGDLRPDEHWYPLGYPLLAVPFGFLKAHRFFLVDLACLLATFLVFIRFARRLAVSDGAAALLFLLTTCADTMILRQWVIPWTTSPSAVLIWLLLLVAAGQAAGERRPFLLGMLAMALPLFRPTDAIVSAICLAWAAMADLRAGRLRVRHIGLVAAGGGVLLLPYAALYLAIYGPHPTPYTLHSQEIGFTAQNPVWRAYVLLIEPRQWFFAGRGLFARMPWLILGVAGAIAAWLRPGPARLLSLCLTAYCLLFVAYVDLLPTGV